MSTQSKMFLTKTFENWGTDVGLRLLNMGTLSHEVHSLLEEWMELNTVSPYGTD